MNPTLETTFADRLVTLQGDLLGLRAGLTVTADPAATEPVINFTASDETVDRYREIITAAGWQLDNYRRNPVFQDSHDYSSVMKTIGRAELTEIRGTALFQSIRFAVDQNPLAKMTYQLYRGKFLNAVSVGFLPLEWEQGTKEQNFRKRFTRQELIETSAVGIPANPNALANAFKAGAVTRGDLLDVRELLNNLCSDQADHPANTRALGAVVNEARALHVSQLLTQIRALVRM